MQPISGGSGAYPLGEHRVLTPFGPCLLVCCVGPNKGVWSGQDDKHCVPGAYISFRGALGVRAVHPTGICPPGIFRCMSEFSDNYLSGATFHGGNGGGPTNVPWTRTKNT